MDIDEHFYEEPISQDAQPDRQYSSLDHNRENKLNSSSTTTTRSTRSRWGIKAALVLLCVLLCIAIGFAISREIALEDLKNNIEESEKNKTDNSGDRKQITLVCEDEWTALSTSCYYFSHESVPWSTAQTICQSMVSNLVKITSRHEDDLIVATIMNKGYTDKDYWIGLHDMNTEGQFIWVSDNTEVAYQNWAHGEPNAWNEYQDCGQLYKKEYFQWDDVECSDRNLFICQKPQNKT